MAEKKYYIRVPEALVEVSKEVYEAFWRMDRHCRTLEEKDIRNHVFSYDAMDTDEMLGVEIFPDLSTSAVEDQAVASVLSAKLHRCLDSLSEEERNLIQAIYYEGVTEKEFVALVGISQKAVSKRLHRILQKLQILINR